MIKVEKKKLYEMIESAIKKYVNECGMDFSSDKELDEANLDLRGRLAGAKPGSTTINLDKLMVALDGAEKQGKKAITAQELQALAKQSMDIQTPLGKGNMGQMAAQVGSKTGGQPLVAPPAGMMAENTSGKIKMTRQQLKEMVVSLLEFDLLGKKNPIMAKREIIALMDATSRNFEREIIKTFNLRDPDELTPELQRKYLEVVEGMKGKLVAAAMEAVQQLISFPTNDDGNK